MDKKHISAMEKLHEQQRYLNYIGQQFHTDPNLQLLYRDLTTDDLIDVTEIKCGVTTIDANSTFISRFTELGRTKAPIGWMPIYVFEAEDLVMQERIESAFKILCDTLRCKSNGLTEYYDLPISTAVKFYKAQGAIDVSSEFLTEQFDSQSGLSTRGAKKVRTDSKARDAMEAKWSSTGLFTNYGSSYASYNNVDSVPGLNNVSFHPNGKIIFINYYHGGKLDGNEEFESMMIDLGKEKGLEPNFNKGACRLNQKSLEEGVAMFKVLKEQDFVPMDS